jgi:hypothetical protein
MNKLPLWTGAVLLIMSSAVAMCATAHAADQMIRPQCWESNENGVPQRHCEVDRPIKPGVSHPPAPAAPSAHAGPPPVYAGPPPVRAWPTRQCLYGPPPCPVYYDYGPAPAYGPMAPAFGYPPPGYYPYPPPYYGPPPFVIGVGPFQFWF